MMIYDKYLKLTAITLVIIFQALNQAYSKELPKIREMGIEPVSIKDYPDILDNYSRNNRNNIVKSEKNIKNDAVSAGEIITGIVGKSKFVRFDSSLKRVSIANPVSLELDTVFF